MSTAPATAASHHDGAAARLRNVLIGSLFALVLLIPKLLHIRRNPQSWMALRVFLGFAGAALVVLPLSLWNSWLAAPAGLVMFLAAILLPPAKPHAFSNEKARELGALVVVNGGKYRLAKRRLRARSTLRRRSANLRARFSSRAAPRHSRRGNYLGARAPNQKPLVPASSLVPKRRRIYLRRCFCRAPRSRRRKHSRPASCAPRSPFCQKAAPPAPNPPLELSLF